MYALFHNGKRVSWPDHNCNIRSLAYFKGILFRDEEQKLVLQEGYTIEEVKE